VNLSDIIPNDCVLADLKSTRKEDVLREMVAALVNVGKIDQSDSVKAFKRLMGREEVGSTGIGDGVAVPHCSFDAPTPLLGVFGRSTTGIEYDAVDGRPVNLLFLLMSSNIEAHRHLAALACVSVLVRDDAMLRSLRAAKDADELRMLLQKAEFK
jgi:mannitol/fructose-specific phosphotransferase system IIA component (Ntr-type)